MSDRTVQPVEWQQVREHYWRSRLGIVTAFPCEGGLDPWYAYGFGFFPTPDRLGPFDNAREAKEALEDLAGVRRDASNG